MLTYEAERLVEVELMQEEVVFVLVVISIGVLPKKSTVSNANRALQ